MDKPEYPLSMTYSADEKTEDLEGVEVSPNGDVTVGVPLILAQAVPPPDETNKENN